MSSTHHILALSGGVGGAKLSLGLAHVLPDKNLTILVNTGDDFEHMGLMISPDVDTTLYTLGGVVNTETGWGRADETWSTRESLKELGQDTWFLLGDKDIALHITRRMMQDEGHSLTDITQHLANQFGVDTRILPMSNDPVRTIIETANGDLPFQEYFVKHQCVPRVTGFHFQGIDAAEPNPEVLTLLQDLKLTGIVLCPSNPYVSIDPILSLPGMRDAITASPAPVIAVSPIVKGMAIKGPAAKMMSELQQPSTPLTVAQHYRGLLDGFVIDIQDADQAAAIEDSCGIPVHVCDTMMVSLDVKKALAKNYLSFLKQLQG